MNNPLETIDKIVWELHGKIAASADKHLGLNKYDLALFCDRTTGVSWVGGGVYEIIASYLKSSGNVFVDPLFYLALGFIAWGSYSLKRANKINEQHYRDEIEMFKKNNGAVQVPKFSIIRPINLALGAWVYAMGKLTFYYGSQIDNISLKNSSTAAGLGSILLSITYFSKTSADYFRSQITPPSMERKPSFLKRMYDYVRRPKESVS